MALYKDFFDSPHAILAPEIRWVPVILSARGYHRVLKLGHSIKPVLNDQLDKLRR